MKQLAEADEHRAARDAAFHRYHEFELVVGALQIAIVLASVAVVTRIVALAVGGSAWPARRPQRSRSPSRCGRGVQPLHRIG